MNFHAHFVGMQNINASTSEACKKPNLTKLILYPNALIKNWTLNRSSTVFSLCCYVVRPRKTVLSQLPVISYMAIFSLLFMNQNLVDFTLFLRVMLANPKGLTISIALSYSRDDFVLRSRKSSAAEKSSSHITIFCWDVTWKFRNFGKRSSRAQQKNHYYKNHFGGWFEKNQFA